MQLNEVLALMLIFGQKRFVAGPMMILADLVTVCNLEWLFSYLVIARGDITGLTALVELLQKKDAQEYLAHPERMTIFLYHWIYCSLVFASGLFVGVDRNQPLYSLHRIPYTQPAGGLHIVRSGRFNTGVSNRANSDIRPNRHIALPNQVPATCIGDTICVYPHLSKEYQNIQLPTNAGAWIVQESTPHVYDHQK